jgi:hypothetical protein
MKKLLKLAFLTIGMMVNAQDKFNVSVYVDPGASIKEKGIDFGAEIEYHNKTIYTKAGFQNFAVLQGGYTDIAGGIGLNKRIGIFEKFRVFGGVRLGFIFRGDYTYPLAGAEFGLDYKITEKIFIRWRNTYDYRSDFKFSGAKPKGVDSNSVGVGIEF